MENSKLAEQIKCSVCYEVPPTKIFQCKNEHIICSICSDRVSKCPSCWMIYDVPKIQNKLAEQILDSMTFECSYKEYGCNVKTSRRNISKHKQSCEFRGDQLKLCELLGYTCDFVTCNKNIKQAEEHFRRVHVFMISETPEYQLYLEDLLVITHHCKPTQSKPVWAAMLKDNKSSTTYNFLLSLYFNNDEKSFVLNCIQLNGETEENSTNKQASYRLDMALMSCYPETRPDIFCSTQPVLLKKAAHAIKNQCIRIPNSTLCNYARNGTSTLNFVVEPWEPKLGKRPSPSTSFADQYMM